MSLAVDNQHVENENGGNEDDEADQKEYFRRMHFLLSD